MSGFASLLNQFKETTQAAASGGGRGISKRPRSSSFEQSSSSVPHNERERKQSKIHQPEYCYPSTTPVKRIYIACPANTETGGPEALHQLCHIINSGEYYFDNDDGADTQTLNDKSNDGHDEFGRLITNNKSSSTNTDTNGKRRLKAFMLYLRERSASVEQVFGDRSPRPSKYDKYNAPMMEHHFPPHPPESNNSAVYSSDLVIWPEVWTHLIDSLQQSETTSRYQSAIWWLSVNNNKGKFSQHQFTLRKDVLHLVQSAYARDYVQSKLSSEAADSGSSMTNSIGGQHHVITMTEFIPYTSDEFPLLTIPTKKPASGKDKESKCLYNPAKGMHFTDEIIKRACGKQAKTERDGSVTGGGIRFCPIGKGPGGRERMTGEEVVELLKTAKVYVDFGPHPGMDRLPREAALAGCVVITNREGAAKFDKDVPLPSEFKFQRFDADKIFALIKECCTNHDEYVKKMDKYKSWIVGQRSKMEDCVGQMVNEIITKRMAVQKAKLSA